MGSEQSQPTVVKKTIRRRKYHVQPKELPREPDINERINQHIDQRVVGPNHLYEQRERQSIYDQTDNQIMISEDYNLTTDNYHDRIKDFQDKQQKAELEFLERQNRERSEFVNKQRTSREQFTSELSKFRNDFNPYELLGIDQNVSLSDLKKVYKKFAKKYHPDKQGGSSQKFEYVTKAYLFIEKELLEREEARKTKSHLDLRKGAEDYFKGELPTESIYVDKKNFNVKKFNEIFDKYRVKTVYDDGYQDMMNGEDIPLIESDKKSKLFTDDFNIKIFNKVFNESGGDEDPEDQVIVYKEPEALVSGQLKFTELGQGRVNDFSGKSDNNRLQFTDYKQGYVKQNRLIDPNKVEKRRDYRNINELKMERSKITYDLSHEDKMKIQQMKIYEEERERERLRRLQENDLMYQRQNERLNQIFIKR